MRFSKTPQETLLVELVYESGKREIVKSPYANKDKTIWYYRTHCIMSNGEKIVEVLKVNFD